MGDVKVRFAYDYMGRRVRKEVLAWNDGASDWAAMATTDLKFVYDGWNVVQVLDGTTTGDPVMQQYTWGLDLSGTLSGAGGIGGLVAAVETKGTSSTEDDDAYWYFYDGNGNVGQVIAADGQSTVAKYEYDPYGNLIASGGSYADANPFLFSTKWFDAETGLYYYGYRYYAPRIGRWLSRDPIAEDGGLNVYAFVANAPVGVVDPIGMYSDYPFASQMVDQIRPAGAARKQRHMATLLAHRNEIARTIYGNSCGFVGAIDTVLEALARIPEPGWKHAWTVDKYVYNYVTMIQTIHLSWNADYGTVFHEGIHAYHRQKGIFLGLRQDEGIANTATMLLMTAHRLLILENEMAGALRVPLLRHIWRGTWTDFDYIHGSNATMEYGFVIGTADFTWTSQSLGIRVKCPMVAEAYNRALAGSLGCRFVCHQEKGIAELGFAEHARLHEVFR